MRRVTRTTVGIAVLVAAAALGFAAFAFGGHGSGGGGDEHAGHTTTTAEAHPAAGHFKPDQTLLASCAQGDQPCYEQAFGNLAYYEGPKNALKKFDAAQTENPDVLANCHRIVHMIGSASLQRYEGDVAKAFAAGSASCWSGYYHGILERSFAGVKSPEEVQDIARGICDDPEIAKTTFLLYQCVHGLGHGLMIYRGYDLPWALEVCDSLETGWDQSSCTGGVFMENISSSYGIKSKWVRDDDGVYPCREMKERHKLYCYLMVTSRINELNGFDWAATAATCRTVEKDWIETCFESFGRDASGQTLEVGEKIAPLCYLAAEYASSCVYGAARDLTSYDPSGKKAAVFCRVIRDDLRERCWNGVGTIVASIYATPAEQRSACGKAPKAYRADCRLGAGLT